MQPYDPKKEATRSTTPKEVKAKSRLSNYSTSGSTEKSTRNAYKNLTNILSASMFSNHQTILLKIEAAQKLGGCVIDFHI